MANICPVQVVDFGPFISGADKEKVAASILESFKSIGFVYLINHGIPEEKSNAMFEWSKKFFSLPLETKHLAPHPPSGSHHRGYSAPGVEKVSQHIYDDDELLQHRTKAPDVKESFEAGREDDELMPNIWLPEGTLPGFKEACLDFFWTCNDLQRSFLRAIALGFKLPEDYFLKFHTRPDNQLRLLHYPSVPFSDIENERVTRIGSHSDYGTLTLVLQDEVGGLEVEDPTNPGIFKPVPPVAGSIIVNAGDFLMRWSNDEIKSTLHRVRNPPGLKSNDGMTPDRYSIPYFTCADLSTTVDCIPGTYSEENPKKYEPISAHEYIMKRLLASY